MINLFRSKICLAAVLVFLLLSLYKTAYAQPKIAFDEEVFNFGEVMQGEVVEHTFLFQNKGNEELVIEKVSPS
jgi:hypothetical protein